MSAGLKTSWEHVHQCGTCGHPTRIDHIELKIIAAGVITCPKCEFSGPINVKIVDEKMIPERRSSHRNGQ
jgi:DNA-directed RNA polymerase subunit RPC12/RpoP